MSRLFNRRARKIEEGIRECEARFAPLNPADADDSLFVEAGFSEASAEHTAYSNYSYWRSTLRVFLHNRVAVFFLVVLCVMLLFTFVQPLLPNQKSPTKIYYDDLGGMFRNAQPYTSNVVGSMPAGTALTLSGAGEKWATVQSECGKAAKKAEAAVGETSGEYTFVTLEKGGEGWIKTSYLRFDVTDENGQARKDAARVYSNTKLYAFPAKDVYVSSADLEIAPHDAKAKEFAATVLRDTDMRSAPTELAFWFGTNSIGQDLWSRIWSGTRTSLFIGLSVGVLCALIGIVMGAIWGYVRRLDRLFTEIYNVWENIPYTVIRILITYIMRPSLKTIIFVMCVTGWLGMARFVRNQIVIIRDREYNLASRCLGTSTPRMIFRNLLPYLVSVIMLRTALAIPEAISTEVFLTYIGLGLPVSLPSLGNLLETGRQVMTDASLSYQLLYPAVIVSVITVSFYALGNAFSDAADPRNHV